ncbi:hypothetical protein PR048_003930 [Dryococelus australis]|uniref:Uncharacterized protein n=1 Tax=Dryococelus australis TaxID=614101 RepID=A0ABQ9IQH4_9NEOP|nr:hypothetical protein PR048_003930 [Dryococelus australis]
MCVAVMVGDEAAGSCAASVPTSGSRSFDFSNMKVLSSAVDGQSSAMNSASTNSVLVSVPGVSPPVSIVPMSGKRHHSVTVIPKITASAMKTTVPKLTTYTVSAHRQGLDSSSAKPVVMQIDSTSSTDDVGSDALTSAKILDLPIIFAEDDENFQDAALQMDTSETPIVVPINTSSSSGSENLPSSIVTMGDTISFPLEDDKDEVSNIKTTDGQIMGQNVVLIKTGNKLTGSISAGNTQRFLQRIGKVHTTQRLLQNVGNLKCTKIIFNKANPPFKLHSQLESSTSDVSIMRNRIELKKGDDVSQVNE